MTTDPALDANADDVFVEDDDAALEEEIPDVYDAQTERLKVYATLLRVTVPKIGATTRDEFGKEAEIDPDVCSARNLAIMAIFADIRRIAGFEERHHPPDLP
ncbi:hypothetical protein SAMN05444166_0272 [Singulisphaera sp. GP187]|uniref:hypothetical protein n=1 Tax=Singulisphaera sp. GP187 TaxID=1882752 RepID=UPI00092BD026|nr:hypothetical protein [Singulisphaera sp. GP187]SIN70533.1 hypothetical protein SAMN05444166_0272 [Singulisphaera sp. GP187]